MLFLFFFSNKKKFSEFLFSIEKKNVEDFRAPDGVLKIIQR